MLYRLVLLSAVLTFGGCSNEAGKSGEAFSENLMLRSLLNRYSESPLIAQIGIDKDNADKCVFKQRKVALFGESISSCPQSQGHTTISDFIQRVDYKNGDFDILVFISQLRFFYQNERLEIFELLGRAKTVLLVGNNQDEDLQLEWRKELLNQSKKVSVDLSLTPTLQGENKPLWEQRFMVFQKAN